MVIGRELFHYPELDSTNEEARRLIKKGKSEGVVVIADRQTKGRGKPGSGWFSPSGNLYFSAILKPYRSPSDLAPLTLFSALAARAAILDLIDLPVVIKWPNDLLVHGLKVAGILVEGVGDGHLIVGIGINVKTSAWPPELGGKATSLLMATGKEVSLECLTALLIARLNENYRTFLNHEKNI
ncbi:MAG: biotin--[acetyl-CoA-carboxylase] ligase [Candidatus Margulisiibacteriota bacterium]|jgi:BirA family biotin operon repressor/biotin-[acetyl-CoA-carboxylase] ligase